MKNIYIKNHCLKELLQLGERIGNVSTGLSKETIAIQLKTKLFSPSPVAINLEELPPEEDGENNSCLICQVLYFNKKFYSTQYFH